MQARHYTVQFSNILVTLTKITQVNRRFNKQRSYIYGNGIPQTVQN